MQLYLNILIESVDVNDLIKFLQSEVFFTSRFPIILVVKDRNYAELLKNIPIQVQKYIS